MAGSLQCYKVNTIIIPTVHYIKSENWGIVFLMHYTQLVHLESGYELKFVLDFFNMTPLIYLILCLPSTHAGRWAWPGVVKDQDKILIEVCGTCVIQPPCSYHSIWNPMWCVCISIWLSMFYLVNQNAFILSPVMFLFSFWDEVSHWTESSLTG